MKCLTRFKFSFFLLFIFSFIFNTFSLNAADPLDDPDGASNLSRSPSTSTTYSSEVRTVVASIFSIKPVEFNLAGYIEAITKTIESSGKQSINDAEEERLHKIYIEPLTKTYEDLWKSLERTSDLSNEDFHSLSQYLSQEPLLQDHLDNLCITFYRSVWFLQLFFRKIAITADAKELLDAIISSISKLYLPVKDPKLVDYFKLSMNELDTNLVREYDLRHGIQIIEGDVSVDEESGLWTVSKDGGDTLVMYTDQLTILNSLKADFLENARKKFIRYNKNGRDSTKIETPIPTSYLPYLKTDDPFKFGRSKSAYTLFVTLLGAKLINTHDLAYISKMLKRDNGGTVIKRFNFNPFITLNPEKQTDISRILEDPNNVTRFVDGGSPENPNILLLCKYLRQARNYREVYQDTSFGKANVDPREKAEFLLERLREMKSKARSSDLDTDELVAEMESKLNTVEEELDAALRLMVPEYGSPDHKAQQGTREYVIQGVKMGQLAQGLEEYIKSLMDENRRLFASEDENRDPGEGAIMHLPDPDGIRPARAVEVLAAVSASELRDTRKEESRLKRSPQGRDQEYTADIIPDILVEEPAPVANQGILEAFEARLGTTDQAKPHLEKIASILLAFHEANSLKTLRERLTENTPGHSLKKLEGGSWSIRVNDQFRITFDVEDPFTIAEIRFSNHYKEGKRTVRVRGDE